MIKEYLISLGFKSKINLQNYLNIEGWLTPNEANGLFEVSSMLPKESIVLEIGSWKGKSTWCIAQGLKKGIINCIDPFNAAGEEGSKEIYEKTKGNSSLFEQFQNNMKGISPKVKIITHKGYSSQFVNKIENIDFLFIDGDHSIEGCKFDFENYGTNLKIGGYLAFHDYYEGRNELGPTWVIDNIVKRNSAYIDFKKFDSLFIFQKIK